MSIRVVDEIQIKTIKVGALTIDRLISHYVRSNEAAGKSPKTISWYRDILSQFSTHLKAEKFPPFLSSFRMETIRDYIVYLLHKPRFKGHPHIPEKSELLSVRTVQCHVRTLKAFSSWLYEEGHTESNILRNLKLPKAPAKVMEPLTPTEIQVIIHSIDIHTNNGIRNQAMITTLLDTGLRASELTTIDLDRLNLKEGFITVMGKGSKERVVPIGKYTVSILLNYINSIRLKPASPDCNRLFLSPSGNLITTNTVKLLFSRLAKNSGIQRLHAHLC